MKTGPLLVFLCLIIAKEDTSFKTQQLEYQRVRDAYIRVGENIDERLREIGIEDKTPFDLHFKAFKHNDILELWCRGEGQEQFTLFQSFPIAARSGDLGPKRQQGDLQVPEGFYTIDRFNPWSSFHLSLGIDYPNKSDRIRGTTPLGGDIFIHGEDVTVGCLPMTNRLIETIYLLAVESRDRSNRAITVHIYPMRMDEEGLSELNTLSTSEETKKLWADLELEYTHFTATKSLPIIGFRSDGSHTFTYEQ